MLESLRKRSGLLANIGIVVVGGLLIFFLAQIYLASRDWNEPQPETPRVSTGSSARLQGVDWASNGRTLALVVQKNCGYCTASMPFYKRLLPKASEAGIRVIVVSPDTEAESRAYLESHGVTGVAEFHSAELSAVNARGTPTVILFDDNGTAVKTWYGKLRSADAEQKLLDQL